MRLASIAIMTAFTAFAGISAAAEEKPVRLTRARGLDKVETHCGTCHSLDYVQMNSPFLSAVAWGDEVAKMINAFGASIGEADAKTIVDYLSRNYGNQSHALAARSADIETSSLEKKKRRPAQAFAFIARRRPLVRTTTEESTNKEYEEFNLEGVLERRPVVRWGAGR
jgi:hypothetical protein